MSAGEIHRDGALLALNGVLPEASFLIDLDARHAITVAADGAALGLDARGLLPDLIIGDLDSIGEREGEFVAAGSRVIRVESQEENDLEKGLRWIADQGFHRVTIVGAAGGMVDHALNNFSVLARFARRLAITLLDPAWHGYIVAGPFRLATHPGERISIIPLPSALLTTAGLAWELRSERLDFGVREGASNRATGDKATVEVTEGVIALIHYPGRAG